jgi:hypothetical protein
MSANLEVEIQEKIKALPPDEQERVLHFVEKLTILALAADGAREKRVGSYNIAVRVNGEVQEVKDEAELARLVSSGANVEYHGILVDGYGSSSRETIWEKLQRNLKDVPDSEFAELPSDASENLDHYLYGAPKK